ncbi:MAG TPA: hypothetical protein VFM71_12195 [Gemmatimonadaceae bacterium]|nr:hypothetical protein [Gemmatimonadaceae bacterium]
MARPWALVAVAALAALAALAGAQDAPAPAGIGFSATLAPDTVYVGQQATYALTVRIPAEVRQRLRRNPEFVPPETRAMLAYDLPVPRPGPRGEGPEVHVFRRALFPLTPGRYTIPPARLSYSIPQSPSFFSREEARTLRSAATTLVVLEPPDRGRPEAWSGAVGRWRASASVDPAATRVGDPFVLTLRVEGVGNATLLPRPALEIDWASVVPEDERVVLDSTPTTLSGFKEFTWLVTPRVAGTRFVPAIEFPFFDPIARTYETARTRGMGVRVAPGDLVTIPDRGPTPGAAVPLGLRPALEGPAPVTLPLAPVWLGVVLLAPLPWVVARWRERRRRARTASPRARPPEERLRDPAVKAASDVRGLFDAALRRRTGIALETVTDEDALARALRREGVTPETAAEAERVRNLLDAAAYSNGSHTSEVKDRVRTLLRRIDLEARKRAAGLGVMILLVLSLAGCIAVSPAGEQALVAFTQGQTAYTGADYERARDAFLRAANAAPRDPAAWANLGTAAWQAADTAAAVLGWQRALRLDPTAGDLRSRLGLVRAPQLRGAARVWPLPIVPLGAAAVLLWCVGWGWAAKRRFAQRSARGAALALVPAMLLGALAAVGEHQSRASNLLVIATSTPLRTLPALGADPGAVPLVGEIVRVRERRDVWVRIELGAGRSGWYPTERTYPLARQ